MIVKREIIKRLNFIGTVPSRASMRARGMSQANDLETEKKPFSMKSIKQQFFNEHLLKLFICKSGLEQSLIKYEETLVSLRNYAVIFS